MPGKILAIATNCNGGVKEVLCFDEVPERSALWHWRCPRESEFSGTLPPILDRATTHHWFDPCELLARTRAASSKRNTAAGKRAAAGKWPSNAGRAATSAGNAAEHRRSLPPAHPDRSVEVAPGPPPTEIRLAEIVATLSLASDLAVGQPYEHAQRAAIGAMLLGESLGLAEADLKDTYYITLLRFIGCVGDDDIGPRLLGEDFSTWGSHLPNGPTLDFLWAVVQNTGKDLAFPRRVAKVAGALSGMPAMLQGMRSHCEVGRALAERLGLGERVSRALTQVYERWDGGGVPNRLQGDAIDLPRVFAHVFSQE